MNLKIDAAVVILYHPAETILENILTYIDHVHNLFIIDNSITEHTLLQKLSQYPNVEVLHSGANIGIAQGLNIALEKAYSNDIKWLMTLDQDTSYNQKNIDQFIHAMNTLKDDSIAIVSPLHNHKLSIDNSKETFVNKNYVMTSANIVNVPIAKEIGGYDEKLFIDEVDHEFCFRLKNNGYSILQHTSISVNHSLGTSHKYHAKIKLYAPIRLYYMVRNYLYLKRQYSTAFPLFFKKRNTYLVKFFLNQILYGTQRKQNLKMIFRGIKDYKNKKYGKYMNE